MKSKKTIIISSLIMCLTLIVAVVSVTAAWFGNVTQQKLTADLTIGSGTVDASADIQIESGASSGEKLYPAVADLGYYLKGDRTPGNYGIYPHEADEQALKQAVSSAKALYPTNPTEPEKGNKTLHLSKEANVVTFYLTIKYVGPADQGAEDGKKSVELLLEGVYLASQLTPDAEDPNKYSGYETALNYKNEFNVAMGLVQKQADGNYTPLTSSKTVDSVAGNEVYFNNDYSESNPYGHSLKMRIGRSVTYTVKFEIYFNKIDEECNMDLLNTKLVLHITLDQNSNYLPPSGNANP